jgi:uncharacterized protein involved in high-affinity Fe2+ transport
MTKSMRKVLTVLALSGILASCGVNQTKSTSELNLKNNSEMNNKEIVGTFLGAVAKQDAETMRNLQMQITFNTIHLCQQV